jgi:hypothetical protein
MLSSLYYLYSGINAMVPVDWCNKSGGFVEMTIQILI